MIVMILSVFCACVVMTRIICLAAHLSPAKWPGHRPRFLLFSVALAGMAAAAFGVVVGLPYAGNALLISSAGLILFDRRQRRTGG